MNASFNPKQLSTQEISDRFIHKVQLKISEHQNDIASYELEGNRTEALKLFDDMNALIKLRNAYYVARAKGLI